MSNRLENISTALQPSRLEELRKKYPMEKKNLLEVLFGKKYLQYREMTFDVIDRNPEIFKHADLEDLSFE